MKRKNKNRKRTTIILIFLMILFLDVQVQGQAPPKKYALLIGINHYLSLSQGVPTLNYAVDDVDAMKDVLEEQGFEVTVRRNEDAERRKIVHELYRIAQLLNENDFFLLFFAGHGVRNKVFNDKTYWLTYDADLRALDVAGIRLKHLLDYIQDIKARYKLILLDHCFSGDVVRGGSSSGGARGNGSGANLSIVRNVVPITDIERQIREQGEGMVIIAAASNQAIESASLGHGIFTAALLKAITSNEADANKNNELEIDELKNYLKTQVPSLARSEANYDQQIVESTIGVNLTGWKIVTLPLDDLETAKEISENYSEKLVVWELRNWITSVTRLHCNDALEMWKKSIETSQAMDSKYEKVFKKLDEYMKLTNLAEDTRARALNDIIEVIMSQ